MELPQRPYSALPLDHLDFQPRSLSDLALIYCEKSEFGHTSCSSSLNSALFASKEQEICLKSAFSRYDRPSPTGSQCIDCLLFLLLLRITMKNLPIFRNLAIAIIALASANSVFAQTLTSNTSPIIKQNAITNDVHLSVHKDPNCGCCTAWIEQLPSTFKTTIRNTSDISAIKETLGVPHQYRSCHTAISKAGFIFEGHVPNTAIQSFLANPPAEALGLAVPGMPIGSPGMEVGDKTMRYPIYQLNKDGTQIIYAHANGKNIVE